MLPSNETRVYQANALATLEESKNVDNNLLADDSPRISAAAGIFILIIVIDLIWNKRNRFQISYAASLVRI